jgi:predicted enzyme related to lactoylglutathione lyase
MAALREHTSPRFAHVSLVAEDWRRMAAFYQDVFECVPIPPERDLHGEWLDRATGLRGAHIRGIHLRFPGFGDTGPTLEIFEYMPSLERPAEAVNTPGFGHIAFAVQDVEATAQDVVKHGGSLVGVLTEREIPGAGTIIFQYLADPEGNAIEIQRWSTAD